MDCCLTHVSFDSLHTNEGEWYFQLILDRIVILLYEAHDFLFDEKYKNILIKFFPEKNNLMTFEYFISTHNKPLYNVNIPTMKKPTIWILFNWFCFFCQQYIIYYINKVKFNHSFSCWIQQRIFELWYYNQDQLHKRDKKTQNNNHYQVLLTTFVDPHNIPYPPSLTVIFVRKISHWVCNSQLQFLSLFLRIVSI